MNCLSIEFATAMKNYVEEPEYFDINDGNEDDDQDSWSKNKSFYFFFLLLPRAEQSSTVY